MLEELLQVNDIGGKNEILFFLQEIIGSHYLTIEDIRIISFNSQNNLKLRPKELIAFCTYLKIIRCTHDKFHISDEYLDKYKIQSISEIRLDFIIDSILKLLIENNILTQAYFRYDLFLEAFKFNSKKFPLEYSTYRNILISYEFFKIVEDSSIIVNKQYEYLITDLFHRYRKISLEELRNRQLQNIEDGEKAEQFVLDFERKRLRNSRIAGKIKQVSILDVAAGYDIISFDNEESTQYDRFIEVKSYRGNEHFYWSRNEIEIAKLKQHHYFLYLVKLEKFEETDYKPIIIQNPIEIFDSELWFKQIENYKITRLSYII